MVGHNVSHSNIKSKRDFNINKVVKHVTTSCGNKVKLIMSTKMLRTWRKQGGTYEALKKLMNEGV